MTKYDIKFIVVYYITIQFIRYESVIYFCLTPFALITKNHLMPLLNF